MFQCCTVPIWFYMSSIIHFLCGVILAMPSEVSFWFNRLQYIGNLRLSHTTVCSSWGDVNSYLPNQGPDDRLKQQVYLGEPPSLLGWLGLLTWAWEPERYLHHQKAHFRKDAGSQKLHPSSCCPRWVAKNPTRVSQCSWQRSLWNLQFSELPESYEPLLFSCRREDFW